MADYLILGLEQTEHRLLLRGNFFLVFAQVSNFQILAGRVEGLSDILLSTDIDWTASMIESCFRFYYSFSRLGLHKYPIKMLRERRIRYSRANDILLSDFLSAS